MNDFPSMPRGRFGDGYVVMHGGGTDSLEWAIFALLLVLLLLTVATLVATLMQRRPRGRFMYAGPPGPPQFAPPPPPPPAPAQPRPADEAPTAEQPPASG